MKFDLAAVLPQITVQRGYTAATYEVDARAHGADA
jgi:hypothetical protein